MAEEYYPTASDPKRTVEKPVRQKPTIEQLTKIESPGRPMPASNLEEKPKRKRKTKRAKATKSATKIEKGKRDSTLILTEKPQAANKIANALGSPRRYTENNVSFYELKRDNKNIIVACTVGHLFNLTYEKGQTGWPIFKTKWIPSYNQKSLIFTKRYFDVLKKLEKRAKEFIIASDYDIEGEVIGWNVLRFILKQEDAKRMKFSTLTKGEITRAYENPMPTLDWGQAYAGEARHKIDWLYGINLSRALMSAIKRTGAFKILSIGRVQGPALKVIVDREREIKNFKPEPYWQVFAITPEAETTEFKHPKNIFDKEELKEFENITEAEAETTEKEEKIMPPPPFNLTSLQRDAYNLYKISPSATLKSAQSLYLSGLISYPRTSSEKIPKDIEPKEILKKLEKLNPKAKNAKRSTPIEGKKSDPAHPSIYPTGEIPGKIDEQQQKILNLIVRRFISCFSDDAEVTRKNITLRAKNKNFTASGLKIKNKGWTDVYPAKLEEKDIPTLNGKVKISEIKTEERETQPPKRFTPASLVTLLEKKNLGTKTTRSMIIDILFDRGYLEGKSIQATPLGMKLIESLEKYSPIIIDENLTRDLEEKMQEIENLKDGHKEKEEKVLENVKKLITDISKEFRQYELEIGKALQQGTEKLIENQKEQNILMPCPQCKKGDLTIKYSKKIKKQFVACTNYPDCKATYSLPPNSFIKKTEKTNEEGLPILLALRKGKRPWEFTFDPNWKAKQENSSG